MVTAIADNLDRLKEDLIIGELNAFTYTNTLECRHGYSTADVLQRRFAQARVCHQNLRMGKCQEFGVLISRWDS